MGFFHGVTRKAFGDPHIGGCEQLYRFIGGKTKDCPRCRRHIQDQVAQLSGCRSPASGASGAHGPRQALEDQDPEMWNSLGPFLHLRRCQGSMVLGPGEALPSNPRAACGAEEHTQMNLRPLLHFPCISLGLGEITLSFKLTSLPILPGLVLGPPPIQSLSWLLGGFLILPYPILSRVRLLRLWRHLGVYCACLSRGISPSLDLPPPGNLGEHGLAPS